MQLFRYFTAEAQTERVEARSKRIAASAEARARKIAEQALRAQVGTLNTFMQDGGCMRGEILTPVEELLVVDALVKNIERHPDEWTFDNYYGSRATPLLKVWLANGVQWTRMETDHGNFGLRTVSQRRVFDALHKCRHEMQADFIKPLVNALAPPHEETVAKLAEIIKPKQLPAPQLVEAV